jgi:hypothetical protein
MKSLLVTVPGVLILSLSCTGLSQGTFQFQNLTQVYGVDAPVFDANGLRLEGPNYLAELYGGTTVSSLAPAIGEQSGTRVMAPFFTGIGVGYFQGPSVSIPGVIGGTMAWVQVRAWDARLGATYEQVSALGIGGYGQSILVHLTSGNPSTPTSPAPLIGLQSFSLLPVIPEPSTWALLALGGTALWRAWRRRRLQRRL